MLPRCSLRRGEPAAVLVNVLVRSQPRHVGGNDYAVHLTQANPTAYPTRCRPLLGSLSVSGPQYFEVEQRSNVIKANPGMKFGAVTQQLAALWRGASDTQKAPYIERARRDSIRYNDDMARWKQQAKYARKPATRGRSGRPPTKKVGLRCHAATAVVTG